MPSGSDTTGTAIRLTLESDNVVTRTDDRTRQRHFDLPAGIVTAVGSTLGLLGIIYLVTHPEPLSIRVFEGAIVAGPTACLVYGGYWIATRSSERSDRRLAAGWTLASAVITGYVLSEQFGGAAVTEVQQLALFGASSGAFVAFFTVISIQFQSQVLQPIRLDRIADSAPPKPRTARRLLGTLLRGGWGASSDWRPVSCSDGTCGSPACSVSRRPTASSSSRHTA